MATVDKLVVKIEADLADLKRKLSSAQSQTKRTTKSMGEAFGKLKTQIGGVGRGIFSLQGALVALGVGAGIKSLINVGSEVESLQIRFETLFGSAKEGQKAFEEMASFASKVPFSLQEIQAGAGSLLAVADDAEELGRLMEMTGTIAAATGLDFRTTSEQIQRSLSAGIGAADLFRDRGVTALLGFKAGVQTSVEDSRQALEKFAKDNDGITDRLAGTFQGTMSMLGDAVFSFQRPVNDAGFFASLTTHFQDLKKEIDTNQKGIKEFAEKLSGALVGAMNSVRKAVVFVVENFETLKKLLVIFIGLKVVMFLSNVVIALKGLAGALGLATVAQKGLNLAVLRNPYVMGFTAIAGGILYIASTYKKVAETIARSEGKLKDHTEAVKAEGEEFETLAETLRKVNKAREAGLINPKGFDDAGGVSTEHLREVDKRENTRAKSIKSIEALIQAEKDNQAQLTLSSFELAKYNLEKENDLKLTDEKLKMLELEMAKTEEIKSSQKELSDIIADMQQIDIDQAEIDFARIEKQKEHLAFLEELKDIEEITAELDKEKLALEKEMQSVLEASGQRTKEYTEEQNNLNQALALGIITQQQYQNEMELIKQKQFEATETGKIATEAIAKTSEALSNSITDQIMGMGEGMKSFKDSLKGIARDIIAQFIKMQIQAAITKAAMSFMGGGGGGSIASFFGGKAGGGFVQSNKPVLVGERGPELFVPSTAGNVMTNNRSRQASGGSGTVNQTLNFDVGVAQTVRSEILSLMPTIKQESITAMVDAKERGGRVADVFK